MKQHSLPILLSAIALLAILAACDITQGSQPDPTEPPVAELPPTQESLPVQPACDNNQGETRIKYIMADIQLGNMLDFYAGFPEDELAAGAVNLWNSGVRVANIDAFERRDVPGVGWQVVYLGTDTTICGDEVLLTDPPQVTDAGLCGNPYFPTTVGTRWVYNVVGWEDRWDIREIYQSDPMGMVKMTMDSDVYDSQETNWMCRDDGYIAIGGFDPIFPPLASLTPGFSWYDHPEDSNKLYTVRAFTSVQTPVGTFDAVQICYSLTGTPGYHESCTEYAQGVGPVRILGLDGNFELLLTEFSQ